MNFKVSTTAYGVAKVRSVEMFYPAEERLFDDPYSIKFLPGYTKNLLGLMKSSYIKKKFLELSELIVPGLTGGILCRTCYIDSIIQKCLDDGITNIVNLGAGLDTRGIRLPELKTRRYYEIDVPEIIAYKQKRIKDLCGNVPEHIRFVSVDFQKQSLATRLKDTGFNHNERTLFILEGLIQYLSEDAFDDLFSFLARAVKDSRIVFTYPVKDFLEGTKDYGKIRRLKKYAKKAGLNPENGFSPTILPKILEKHSFEIIEDVGDEYYQSTFIKNLNRKLAVWKIERTAYARKIGA